jgi:MSHA biogenesis protein MshQ
VVGVDATAFTLAASGLSGAFISAVTGAGTTWTVTANTGIGSGTLGLNQTSAGAVQDTFGNALSGTFTGPVYTISGTPDFAEYRMDEASWNGTAGQVVDSSGSGFNATAVNNATTANVSPAIPGSPGTCSYGEFDNGTTITQGYVAVPDSFPNLTTDFTITAWIRTTNNAPTGQRIFIDDQNNTGGYGFSLADSGSPGRLRFYSRAITPIILDSTFTIANNTWYFVAAVADITNQTRTIYVFNSAGVLQNSTTEPPYTGTWGVDVGPASIGAETNASAEAPINFHFHGNLDEVRVYQKVLSQQSLAAIATQTHPCGGQINNFLIDIGAAAASTCASKNITITARDAGNVTLTGYTGTVSISTSAGHGNWSVVTANGTFTPGASDSGAATYTFVTSDNGVITLALSDTHADDTTVSVVDNSVPLSLSTSATINFRSNVFVITPDTVQVAGRNQATNVALWDQDSVTGNCVINTAYTGSKTLEAWLTRDALDPGGAAPTIGALSLPNTAPASSNLSLTFTNGQANFNLSTTDVGKYVLNMLDNTRAFGTGVNISGASNSITTRPFALVVTAITSGATNNPAGTATGGSKFVSAGTSFQATVGAYLWNSAADTNVAGGDGVPDAGATLAQITANGLASKYAWATTLSAASSYTPATGTLAALNNGALAADAFTGGSATPANLSYPEVGSFTLGVSATSFLNSAGVDLTSANGLAIVFDNSATPARNAVVGRFFPDHFTLTASSVTPACAGGGFTYMDQPNLGYSFTIEARNLANVKTANYINSPTYNTGTVSILAENNNNGTDLSARVSAPSGSWSSGSYNYSTTTATFSRLGPGSPDGPYDALQLGVRVADADGPVLAGLNMNPAISGACGAACTGVVIGATTKVRFGRVTIANAFGSELLALPVPLQVEYYNGSGFVGKNATNLDNCTSITAAMLTPSAGTFASVPVGGGTTSGTLANIPVSAGDAGLSFNAPGAGNVGDFTLQVGLGSLPWLRYDWTGTSVNSDPPLARISFGTYPGSGRQIYIREPW